jgi:endonuclease/exonuclease/phosphatase family metal-dependent hydrolase
MTPILPYLNIMSANILFEHDEYMQQKDGTFKYHGPPWEKRRPLFKTLIEHHLPHILCTQEGKEAQARDMATLSSLTLVEHHRSWISERMYPSIYYSPKDILPIKTGDLWLSPTPHIPGSFLQEGGFPRLCHWLVFYHFASKKIGLLANMHLDHLSDMIRKKQIDIFIQEFSPLAYSYPQASLIICGDFNEGPDGYVHRTLLDHFSNLCDPWNVLHKKEHPSHHKFTHSYLEAKRIDWILLDKKNKLKNIFFDQFCDHDLFPSDHYPLVAQFTLS